MQKKGKSKIFLWVIVNIFEMINPITTIFFKAVGHRRDRGGFHPPPPFKLVWGIRCQIWILLCVKPKIWRQTNAVFPLDNHTVVSANILIFYYLPLRFDQNLEDPKSDRGNRFIGGHHIPSFKANDSIYNLYLFQGWYHTVFPTIPITAFTKTLWIWIF